MGALQQDMYSNYTRDNIYLQDMARLYYHDPHEELAEDGVIFLAILVIVVGGWWGIVHLIDWMTLDIISWWAEPFTVIPVLFLFVMCMKYGRNPLHWWPMVWGVRVAIPDSIIFHMNYDADRLLKRYGGPGNVFVDHDLVIFRRSRDAVTFCLLNL